ncbi:MAG: GNAT family N-acetyltransferase [Chloroflexi bacterium]|nr:GNAT family N-acetyltransferase [Chloroflexota bacterium]
MSDSTNDLTFVTLTVDDYAAVCDLWRLAGLPFKAIGRDSREQFAAQIASGLQTVIGVRIDDRLVGVVLTTHDGRKGWINRLAVHPDCRRQGIGMLLIEEAEQVLYRQGMQVIAALIEDENTASLQLFARAGYGDYPSLHYVSKRKNHDV